MNDKIIYSEHINRDLPDYFVEKADELEVDLIESLFKWTEKHNLDHGVVPMLVANSFAKYLVYLLKAADKDVKMELFEDLYDKLCAASKYNALLFFSRLEEDGEFDNKKD